MSPDEKKKFVEGMDDDAAIMMFMTLMGGPKVGFMTNPDAKNHPNFIEINGEKVVCSAQGGECRYNSKYYTPGLGDAKSWRTPLIDESCPDACWYKELVCDYHPDNECKTVFPYSQYNKFQGQFMCYCRNLQRLQKPREEKGFRKTPKSVPDSMKY